MKNMYFSATTLMFQPYVDQLPPGENTVIGYSGNDQEFDTKIQANYMIISSKLDAVND